jgi:spore germination cell wall hydrolase CwlJ-like protein
MSEMPRFDKLKKFARRFAEDESSKELSPEAVGKVARAAALGAAIAGGTLGAATPAEAGQRMEQQAHLTLSEEEIDHLVQNVYHEARGEPLKGQLAVAQVTLARLASGRYGRSLTDVIYKKNQFSWTGDARILMSKIDDTKLQNMRAVLSVLVGGKRIADAVNALAAETGISARAEYYKRTDWNENDESERRMSESGKRMFRSLTPVGSIGHHTFYTN